MSLIGKFKMDYINVDKPSLNILPKEIVSLIVTDCPTEAFLVCKQWYDICRSLAFDESDIMGNLEKCNYYAVTRTNGINFATKLASYGAFRCKLKPVLVPVIFQYLLRNRLPFNDEHTYAPGCEKSQSYHSMWMNCLDMLNSTDHLHLYKVFSDFTRSYRSADAAVIYSLHNDYIDNRRNYIDDKRIIGLGDMYDEICSARPDEDFALRMTGRFAILFRTQVMESGLYKQGDKILHNLQEPNTRLGAFLYCLFRSWHNIARVHFLTLFNRKGYHKFWEPLERLRLLDESKQT